VVALGEVGLDYHYDLSPREEQRVVFRRQIELVHELGLSLVLHLRGGEDPQADNAHAEAFAILQEMDALGPSTLLHCCTLPPDEIRPWIEADCSIAFGGAVTFKNADAAREGVRLVPNNRLLFETDAPYMAPEPMRGAACTPAHVIFTAAALAEIRGVVPGEDRKAFLEQVHSNTLSFYGRNA
jgi:TatD DNase family protein